jgi:dihydroceramidase
MDIMGFFRSTPPPPPPPPPLFWGPITANYDWCEPNYLVTPYIAEFFNALSSLPTATAGAYTRSLFSST